MGTSSLISSTQALTRDDPEGRGSSMAKEKILIVDDDPEILEALSVILESNGYLVDTALNTGTALEKFRENRPDLLVLDIMMATMDEGFHFARELKKDEGITGVPILVVSASPPFEEGYARSRDEDMDWIAADIFMDKPVNPDDLLHNVRLLLKNN